MNDIIVPNLCALCNLAYDKYSRRTQLIDCCGKGCKIKIHRECHIPEISRVEFVRMKNAKEIFNFFCNKCGCTPKTSPLIGDFTLSFFLLAILPTTSSVLVQSAADPSILGDFTLFFFMFVSCL